MNILEQVHAVSPRRETKAEAVEYYREKYGNGWKQHIANDLSPIAGMSPKNLLRRFDPGTKGGENRLARVPRTRREREQYEELGELLPPMPAYGYHIEGTIWVKFSDGNCEEREVNEDITGDEARALFHASHSVMEDMILNHYMTDHADDEDHPASYGDCQEPRFTVEAIEE